MRCFLNVDSSYILDCFSHIVHAENDSMARFWLRDAKYNLNSKEYHKLLRLLLSLPDKARIGLAL